MTTDALMSSVVTLRPFVPAKDFQSSQRFYEALGFTVTPLSEKIARVLLGKGRDTASFLLQDFYVKEWAENHMMQLVVADLDRWWQHIESLELDKRFGVGPPRPPKEESWGLRVAYLWDPAGVLWHITAAPTLPADNKS